MCRAVRALSRRTITLLVAAAPLMGACGGTRPPSDSDAAALIQASADFRRPKFAHIPRQVFIPDQWSLRQHSQLSVTQLARFEPTIAILKLQHAVDVVDQLYPDPQYDLGLHWDHMLSVTPTNVLDTAKLVPDTREEFEGDRYGVLDQSDVPETKRTLHLGRVRVTPAWRLPIGRRVFERVEVAHRSTEKMLDLAPNEAAIDFTWKWHADSIGDAFDSEGESFSNLPDSVQYSARDADVRMNTSDPMLSRAILQETNGRWTVRRIQWSLRGGNPR